MSPNESQRVARRLSVTPSELSRYTTLVSSFRTAPVRFTKLLTNLPLTICYDEKLTTLLLRRPYDDQHEPD